MFFHGLADVGMYLFQLQSVFSCGLMSFCLFVVTSITI